MQFLKRTERWNFPDYDDAKDMHTGEVTFDEKKCNRCGVCVSICPGRSLSIDKHKDKKDPESIPFLVYNAPGVSLCVACGCCLAACTSDAITIQNGFEAGYYFRKLHQTKDFALPKRY
ncbi:4Fe-4S dicluster domain-containing protein [Deltaproteobacteria bacterium TL4]